MNFQSSVVCIILIGIALVLGSTFILDFTGRGESDNHPTIKMVKTNFSKIDKKYGDIPIKEGNSAYTEDKSIITLCLKDPVGGGGYNDNTIMYVALHELAHVLTISKDHTPEFYKNFEKLLKIGKDLGFYNPNIPMPDSYCGVPSK